jgi:hypothetical protein
MQSREEELSAQKQMSRMRKTDPHKLIFQLIVLASTGVILSLASYSVVASVMGHIDIVGANLVDVQIPAQGALSFKPISLLVLAGLALTFAGLELARPTMLKLSNTLYSYLKLLIFAGTALCAYEVFYNFAIWIAQLSTASLVGVLNPDIEINPFPNPQTPWNLVFATKLTTLILAVGLYAFYYIRTLEKEKASLT